MYPPGRLLCLLAFSGLAACQPSQAAEPRAGVVIALEGAVTAQRTAVHGSARTLSLNAPVFRDDTVATAADATVQIRLDHNGAAWSLGSGQSARVDKSKAWNMAAGARGDTLLSRTDDKDRTTAAGRPATVDGVSGSELATERGHTKAPAMMPAAPEQAQAQAMPAAPGQPSTNSRDFGSKAKEGNGSADGPQNGPSVAQNGTARATPIGEVKISKLQLKGVEPSAIQTLLPHFRACLINGWKKNPTLQGVIEVRFPIGANGGVPDNAIEFTDKGLGDAEVLSCLKNIIAHDNFKPTGDAPSVSFLLEATAPPF